MRKACTKPNKEKLNFQAVIKSAASAALHPPGIPGEPVDDGSAARPQKRLGSPGIPGGCASSRLDHGCKIPPREAALAADFASLNMFAK